MSFDLTQKIKIVNAHANNDELYGTYTSIAEALSAVKPALRKIGRTVGVIESGSVVEYWFKSGIADSDLVVKTSGSGGGGSEGEQDIVPTYIELTLSQIGATSFEDDIQSLLHQYIVDNPIEINGTELYRWKVVEDPEIVFEADMIHKLTFAPGSVGTGNFNVSLHKGSANVSETVYLKIGTSGTWNEFIINGSEDIPIDNLVIQLAHNFNEVGEDVTYPRFRSDKLTKIEIQNAPLPNTLGNHFMREYAENCKSLTFIGLPDTSNVTSVGSSFMRRYVKGCDSLISLGSLDVSNVLSVGDYFLDSYARECISLTTLGVPDTSSLTSTGSNFMNAYAFGCNKLTTLGAPDTTNLTSVGSYFMGSYGSNCNLLNSLDVPDTSNISTAGVNFMMAYASSSKSLTTLGAPDTSSLTSVGSNFMSYYAENCKSLTFIGVPDTSNVTIIGSNFMFSYAGNCEALLQLSVPDTSNVTSVANGFMRSYASGCTSLTSLSVPDTSSLTTIGPDFMSSYAIGSDSLTSLILPGTGWFETHNVAWTISVQTGALKGKVINSVDLVAWQNLTVLGKTLYSNNIKAPENVEIL